MADRQVRSRIGRIAAIIACSAAGSTLCACAGGDKGRATGGAGVVPALSARPRVPSSAAERFSGPNSSPLDFYDELERRDLVSHDDALHAVLLLSLGHSEQTFVQRVAVAKDRGILDNKFDRPPREAVTIGELSRMLDRAMQGNNVVPKTESQAIHDLQTDGVIPAAARASQGLTGGQMLAVLSAASEVMTSGRGLQPRTIASVSTDTAEPRPATDELAPGPAIAAKPQPAEAPPPSEPAPAATQTQRPPPPPPPRLDSKPQETTPVAAAKPTDQPPPKTEPPPPKPESPKPEEPTPAPLPPPPPPAVTPSAPAPPASPWVGGKPLKKKKPTTPPTPPPTGG